MSNKNPLRTNLVNGLCEADFVAFTKRCDILQKKEGEEVGESDE